MKPLSFTSSRLLLSHYANRFVGIMLCLLTLMVGLSAQEYEVQTDLGPMYGSLLVPDNYVGGLPLTIFIAGSGPTDRNGNQGGGGSNNLGLLADSLAELGIPTFRYDKRGSGKSSAAGLNEAEMIFENNVTDLQAWISKWQSDERFDGIVLAGHSEGALVATLAAQNDSSIVGLITLAGAGRPIDVVIMDQLKKQPAFVYEAADTIFQKLRADLPFETPPFLYSLFRPSVLPYIKSWMALDPVAEMEKVKVPVLVIGGDADLQVWVEDTQKLSKCVKSGHTILYEGMNHVFRKVTTIEDNYASYSTADRPLYPGLSSDIATWILSLR
jgi:pimeloyl-ACP methyl ester carboxylesterase